MRLARDPQQSNGNEMPEETHYETQVLLGHVVWQMVALDIDGSGVGCGWCAKTKRGTSSRMSLSLRSNA
jgi:hypothetical protein